MTARASLHVAWEDDEIVPYLAQREGEPVIVLPLSEPVTLPGVIIERVTCSADAAIAITALMIGLAHEFEADALSDASGGPA